jgi:Na+/phosphate symporter
MFIDIGLAFLALVAVLLGVLTQAKRDNKPISRWGHVALVVGFLVFGLAVAKAILDADKQMREASNREELRRQIPPARFG